MRLPDFISANVEPILAEWDSFARGIWPKGATADPADLRDDAEDILRATADEAGGSVQSADPHPPVRLDGVRVLVVDDEADARRVRVMVLERVGAVVTVAESARAAIEALPKARPDVLVSDLGMPGEDGFDLIRQLRDNGHDARHLPAVALTAFAQKDDAHLALSAGFQVHLPKPVDSHELKSVIARLARRTV